MFDIRAVIEAAKQNRVSVGAGFVIVLLFAASILATFANPEGLNKFFSDKAKFQAFDEACNTAMEKIYSTKKSNRVALRYQPWSGVIEDYYYPTDVAENLLRQNKGVDTVQLMYEMDKEHTVLDSCVGSYIITASKPSEVKIPACGHMTPLAAADVSNIRIVYEYGPTNYQSIRSFRFAIEDQQSHKVLAEQLSYQLLLGGMQEIENRSILAYGSAQGAKVCKLTPPVDFVLKVLAENG